MSGRCPRCGGKWPVEEMKDGTYWCNECGIPLVLVCAKGGCMLIEKTGKKINSPTGGEWND